MTGGNLGQEGDSSSEPCALLADGESIGSFARSVVCDRKLPTAGFTAGEIWCVLGAVESKLQSHFSQFPVPS